MNNSVVYCIDKSFSIKVLDTSKIITEKMKIINGHVEKSKRSYLTEIEKSKLISAYISSQKNIFENNKNLLDTYLYSIIEYEDKNKNIFIIVLNENKIYFVNLIDWLFFLENLQNKKDFINLFSIGIEIYKGKMISFSNLPEEKLKKQIVGDKLKEIINKYIIHNIQELKANQEKINSCIKIVIEILIEIDSFDYLLKSILPILESNNLGELFLTTLEPFILNDKIKKIYLPNNIILNLIDFYNKKNQLDLLSQMLLHININNLDNSEIRQKLEELNLFTPLIHLLLEGKNENYFNYFEKMFEFFYSKEKYNNALINKENNMIDYSNALNNELITEKEVRESKEYNGHKIIYFIKWCLIGKKFPDNYTKMEQNLFENLVPKITYWLLNPKIIEAFLLFDPKNYFIIYKNIFHDNELKKLIINANKDNNKYSLEIKDKLSFSDIKIDNVQPSGLIKYMVDWCKKLNKENIYFYLYDFIVYLLNTEIEIENEVKKEEICFILKNYKLLEKDRNNQEIKIMIKNLINFIEQEKSFNENDCKAILESINDEEFNEVKICLLGKLNKFKN